MKKEVMVLMAVLLVLCAMPALVIAADSCRCQKHCTSCGRPQATDMFQAASDWNDSFHPKPCILQPMKPWGTPERKQVPWFQGLADSINRKCPKTQNYCNASTSCASRCRK